MAIKKLPINFQDDIIDTAINEKRKYYITDNPDGTKSLDDATVYIKIGSYFGAEQINETNGTVNELIDKIEKKFVIKTQILNFLENICTIEDYRITSDSLADVYFTSDTIKNAENAIISVETYNGKVELIAENQPNGLIKAAIHIRVV